VSWAVGPAITLRAYGALTGRPHGWALPNFPATKFSQSRLSLCKPQRFGVWFDFIIERFNQARGDLHAISQREPHRISRELI
jgi:hypothetical protein